MYTQELIVRAFEYFATSRSFYNRLSIAAHQNTDQNNIKSTNFKLNMFHA